MQALFTKHWNMTLVLASFALLLFVSPLNWHLGAILFFVLSGFTFTMLLPPVRRGETFTMARERVWHSVLWDPFFYFSLLFAGLLLWQWQNGGRELVYLFDVKMWRFGDSVLGWGPSCVNPANARVMFYAALIMGISVFSVRHGMQLTGRFYLLAWMCVCAALLSLIIVSADLLGVGGWMTVEGQSTYLGFVSRKAAGTFFGLMALTSLGVAFEAVARMHKRVAGLLGLATGLCLLQVYASVSLTVLAPVILGVVACLVVIAFNVRRVPSTALIAKLVFIVLLGIVLGAGVATFVMPWSSAFCGAFFETGWSTAVADYWEQWELKGGLALSIWEDFPWLGIGAGGYPDFMGFYVSAEQWPLLKAPSNVVMNGYLRGLIEYGVVGVLLLLAVVVILSLTAGRRLLALYKANRSSSKTSTDEPLRLGALPVCLWIACGTVAVEAIFSEPFTTPMLMVPWCIILACSAFFVPTGRKVSKK